MHESISKGTVSVLGITRGLYFMLIWKCTLFYIHVCNLLQHCYSTKIWCIVILLAFPLLEHLLHIFTFTNFLDAERRKFLLYTVTQSILENIITRTFCACFLILAVVWLFYYYLLTLTILILVLHLRNVLTFALVMYSNWFFRNDI